MEVKTNESSIQYAYGCAWADDLTGTTVSEEKVDGGAANCDRSCMQRKEKKRKDYTFRR